jgi:hypothetical protein
MTIKAFNHGYMSDQIDARREKIGRGFLRLSACRLKALRASFEFEDPPPKVWSEYWHYI